MVCLAGPSKTFLIFILSCYTICCKARVCYNLKVVLDGLQNPLAVDFIDDHRMIIAEHYGMLLLFDSRQSTAEVFLNLTDRVLTSSGPMEERGLLGLTLDPNFETNRFFYLFYSAAARVNTADHDNVISRFQAKEDNGIFKGIAESELEILRIAQPGRRQNGGQLFFSDDGHLYVTTGNSEDLKDSRLQLNSLLGKILRVNVRQTRERQKYTIPEDNPFIGQHGKKPEIYAYGFWNPWRCTVDNRPRTSTESRHNKIFCGDVGGSSCNEENLYEISRGGRYGWWSNSNEYCNFSHAKIAGTMEENDQLPIHTYRHDEGQAVIGGIIYRGHQFPELKDNFIFADYVHGTFHALKSIKNDAWATKRLCINYPSDLHSDDGCPHVIGIQRTLNGEILVITNTKMNKREKTGVIYKFSNEKSSKAVSCSFNHNAKLAAVIITWIVSTVIIL